MFPLRPPLHRPSAAVRRLCTAADCSNVEPPRRQFKLPKGSVRRWYPRHMSSSYRFMVEKQSTMAAIIEVHDARIPITGRNACFEKDLLPGIPHLLLFNKVDLISKRSKARAIDEMTQNMGTAENILWTDSKERANGTADRIMHCLRDLIPKQENMTPGGIGHQVMIIGVPNVGKSTIINALRNRFELRPGDGNSRRASTVGAMPGVTKRTMFRIRVHTDPSIFIIDTPGILSPYTERDSVAMKLALCQTVHDTTIGQDYVADYLLWRLNVWGRQSMYTKLFDLPRATDDVTELLLMICQSKRLEVQRVVPGRGKVAMPDILRAAQVWLTAFREGKMGDQFLDDD